MTFCDNKNQVMWVKRIQVEFMLHLMVAFWASAVCYGLQASSKTNL